MMPASTPQRYSPLSRAELYLDGYVDGIRDDLAHGDSPEELAAVIAELFRRDPERGGMLLAAALLRLAGSDS